LPPDAELYGESPDRSFIQSIKSFGIMTPILVEDTQYLPYNVIAGRRRIKAARAAGLTHIPAMVYPHGTITDVLTLIENAERSQNAVSDLESIEALVRQGATEGDISKATGMGLSTIRRRLKLITLLVEFRQQLRAGTLNVSLAERIARLKVSEQFHLLEVQKTERLTAQIVAEMFRVRKDAAVASLPDSMFETQESETVENEPTFERPKEVLLSSLLGEREIRFLQYLRDQSPDQKDEEIIGCALYLQAVRKGYKE
jgi:ParB family chromosome partitioning protein